ncbi:MAG TPA: sodium:solute symporter [Verrucomicrobiae bacterium]|nr:sodium:solute symporter [Verrucomicrobiae bacterium]
MKSEEVNAGPVEPSTDDRNELTGLPKLRTWRNVYVFVFASFVTSVLLLLALTLFYSRHEIPAAGIDPAGPGAGTREATSGSSLNFLDFAVLIGSLAAIAAYGAWHTRRHRNLEHYFRGDESVGWLTIGISVAATQASAITFISTPGQGYESGLDFVQNYFGMPLALILIAAVFLPIYRRLNVYTAYEYLGRRFGTQTRLLGAGLFLLQRGLAAGITIYAPAIILSTVLGWNLGLTIILTGALVIVYTVAGGSQAVSLTQKWQMAIIFGGMAGAFVILLEKLPASLPDAFAIAGTFKKINAVSFSLDPDRRYTFWTGLLGGFFLSLSYFGCDQSQVQRYLSGSSLRESRLGLMVNAVLKIPMQFFILLLGVMLFVFYQFEQPPLFFNQAAWREAVNRDPGQKLQGYEQEYRTACATERQYLAQWLAARHAGDTTAEMAAQGRTLAAHDQSNAIRASAESAMQKADPSVKSNDADYVFVTFILGHLPHGLIGLLIAAFFAAALQSKAAELNALGATTTVDFYRHLVKSKASDAHYVAASRWFTFFWGLVAIAFALFANLVENLIQAINIVGSVFYGVFLALFLVAFFLRRIGGTAVFWGALTAQTLVFILYFSLHISYLWYNLIGCAACVLMSLIVQAIAGPSAPRETTAQL